VTTRLVIQHVSGSKANQIEQFQLDTVDQLTIGRDPGSTLVFDAQRDDAVSRRHATIKIIKGDRPSFLITDLGSSNGTIVNGSRIHSETELLPGDTVQLGLSGPSFTFDVQPRPQHLVARTRIVSDGPAAATRIDPAVGAEPVATTTIVPPPPSTRTGVGRETVQRMLSAERQSISRKWMYTLAGVAGFIVVGSGALLYRMHVEKQATAAKIEERALATELADAAARDDQKRRFAEDKQRSDAELKKQLGMAPSDIVQKYGDSTVYIEVQWRLFDRDTGKALFHKTFSAKRNGPRLPAYVQFADGRIVRWLTTEDENHLNHEVGGGPLSGSGFVINDQGYILTNKHIASGWQVNYNAYTEYEQGEGILFVFQTKREKVLPQGKTFNLKETDFKPLIKWTPDEGGVIFDADQPLRVGNSTCACEGRNERLEVRFPGSRNGIEARLVRTSKDADVALIKVDSPEPLLPVQMADDNTVTVGGAVTVLGYPASSVQTFALHTSIENGELHRNQGEIVPEPTVTPGVISRLSVAPEQHGDVTVVGPMGELYQLTAATGAGNSGGPVFDVNGKVIGLFTYGTSRETNTLAVPIHFGRALMPVQRKS
jgi:serine protease Do